jgi:hypothetical protein
MYHRLEKSIKIVYLGYGPKRISRLYSVRCLQNHQDYGKLVYSMATRTLIFEPTRVRLSTDDLYFIYQTMKKLELSNGEPAEDNL